MASDDESLVIFMPSGRRGRVQRGKSLLDAAREMGVEIESICGGRVTCGKCHVRIENGIFQKFGIRSGPHHASRPEDSELELLKRLNIEDGRLACCAVVRDDLLVFVPEESRAHKQIIRKSATERLIDVDPAVRQVYVAVDEARLGEHRGDWGRLQSALSEQWKLDNLSIDFLALRQLQTALRKADWSVTVTLWQDREVIDVRPGYEEGAFGLAVDIGSTTVALYLCDLRTGELLATESMMNPQVAYGEDLMSRVSYAMTHKDGLQRMHDAIIDTLNTLAARAARTAAIQSRQIHEVVVVGNTTMMHIFLGIDPRELGNAPFALANRDAMDIKARELGLRLHPGAYVHVLPSEAGHVGADNVGVLIAEEPYALEGVNLTVDVGTNAEILLGNRHWMYSASSPTGPAFEGAQITFGMRAAPGAIERVRIDPDTLESRFRVIGEERWSDKWQVDDELPAEEQPTHLAAGICGSGIIEAVGEMYVAGIILPDGRFNPAFADHKRILWNGRTGSYVLVPANQSANGEPIVVTQGDVRNIQLAKAALYAGAKLLMKRADVERVDRIVLAGAFGSYIDPKYALVLGLIPDCPLDGIVAVGNAAGDGARIALLDKKKREEAQQIARWARYIETAVDSDFQQEFVEALHIPHARDQFPNREGLLRDVQRPATPAAAVSRHRRHRRKELSR